MNRPKLDKYISLPDFYDYYWLKEELVTFGKTIGVDTSGSKMDIAQRIAHYIQTGYEQEITNLTKHSQTSKFDCNSEVLLPETVLTDNYRNIEHVRRFFLEQIGDHFSFNVLFMKWAKEILTLRFRMLLANTIKFKS